MSLYKYVSAERALEILQGGLIRFSQPAALNDPFELRPRITSITTVETVTSLREQSHVDRWNELPEDQKRKFGSFQDYRRTILTAGNKAYQDLTNALTAATPENERNLHIALSRTIGILCLTAKHYDLTMWAHYAKNHEGCVLGFDENNAFFNQRLNPNAAVGHVVEVDYQADRPQETLTNITDQKVFFVKSKAWEHEAERRILRLLKDAEQTIPDPQHPQLKIHLFRLPPKCITIVILGHRMGLEIRHKLCETVRTDSRYEETCVLRAIPDGEKFSLHFEDVTIHSKKGGSMEIEVQKSNSNVLDELDVWNWPIWEKEVSEFPWHYDEKETCYLLEGDVTVTPEGGEPVRFGKGDSVTFPAGMSCTWKIHEAVRKHYKFGE